MPIFLVGDETMLGASMRLAQDGDRQAYALVLEHCGDAFERLARERRPAEHTEAETVRRCLLTLHHARHTFDPSRSFSAWVECIALHHRIGAARISLGILPCAGIDMPVEGFSSTANGSHAKAWLRPPTCWRKASVGSGLRQMRLTAETVTGFEHDARKGLRLAMVVVFLVFGLQKFSAIEAMGIAPLVSHSPLTSWLMGLGVRNMSRVFGVAELSFGLLLGTGLWREDSPPAILGALGSCVTFMTTLSFLLTTPGIFAQDTAPVLSSNGLFLVKDLVLLSASAMLLAQSLVARQR